MDTLYITDLDRRRLELLLDGMQGNQQMLRDADPLRELIDTAVVMPSDRIPADVVTMNSAVRYEDKSLRHVREVTLVYPEDSDPASGMVSILSPLGSALLGLRAGQHAHLRLPSGDARWIEVLEVLYQPEAAGSLTT